MFTRTRVIVATLMATCALFVLAGCSSSDENISNSTTSATSTDDSPLYDEDGNINGEPEKDYLDNTTIAEAARAIGLEMEDATESSPNVYDANIQYTWPSVGQCSVIIAYTDEPGRVIMSVESRATGSGFPIKPFPADEAEFKEALNSDALECGV